MAERDAQGHFVSKSDSDDNPNNNTMPYGADQAQPKTKASTETARQFAERGVVERHGPTIQDNPNFKQMVDDEVKQLDENRTKTEGM